MDRKDYKRVVGDTTHAAADIGKEALAQAQMYLEQAQEQLAPRAQDALNTAQDQWLPKAQEAIKQAQEYLAPKASDALASAQGFVAPIAKDARKKGAQVAANTMDTLQPKLDDALDRVSPALEEAYAKLAPAIEAARERVQKDLLPKLNEVLHEAAEAPLSVEAQGRAQAAVAALAGDLKLPEKQRNSALATAGKVALASALLAGVALAVKKLLEPEQAGWQAHEPSSPYMPTFAADEVAETFDDVADNVGESVDEVVENVSDKASDVADDVTQKVDEVVDDVAEGDAAPFADSPYGDGSYAGAEPPEGFVIKGNERSKKFHIEGRGGYDRTIADVWFNSEDAAKAAGFVRAQR